VNFSQDNGSFPNNWYKKGGGRLNATIQATPNLSIDLSSQYLWNSTNIPENGYTGAGIQLPIEIGDPTKGTPTNPHGTFAFSETLLMLLQNHETFNRFVGGVTVNQVLLPSLRHKLTVGLDAGDGTGMTYYPFGFPYIPNGSKSLRNGQTTQANAEYALTWTATLPKDVKSTFSFGGQINTVQQTTNGLTGSNYAIPAFDAIGGTSTQSVFESRVHYTLGGYFGQEEFGFGDRLFITAGMRIDGSSAFGKNLSSQKYPKFGASYVISDQPWFHLPAVTSLRLRTAWGKAGKLPGAFDAVQTYVVQPTAGGAGLFAANPGNPNLAPEISHEWEEGFDIGLWHDRVTFRATAYQQHTDQAILSSPTVGSVGYTPLSSFGKPTAFLSNAGSLQNRGLELGLDWAAIQRGRLSWDVNASYAVNASKILDLHGLAEIVTDDFGTRQRVGFPVSAKYGFVTDGYTAAGVPTINGVPTAQLTRSYIGATIPPNNGTIGSRISYGPLSFNANAQWAQGGYTANQTKQAQAIVGTGEDFYNLLAANGGNKSAPAVLAYRASPLGNFTYRSDFIKLREVTMSYTLPTEVTRGRPTSLYVSGRNVWMATKYIGTDPETSLTYGGGGSYVGGNPGAGLSLGAQYGSTPHPRFFMVGANVSFGGGASR
jgi:hypothetical protein